MQPEARPRILVVDDEEAIVDLLDIGLSNQGFEVAVARDGLTALRRFQEFGPHGVILDIMLPDLDGLQICQRIRALSDVPILMLTAKGELDDRVLGLDQGADDYLSKPFKFKELSARLRALLRRSGVASGHLLRFGDISMDKGTRRVTRHNKPVDLTGREFDLLELLLQRPRQVYSRQHILERLWGLEFEGESNVVEVHVRALRVKLGDAERTLIRAVRGIGYTLGG